MALATEEFTEGATGLVAQIYELSVKLPGAADDEYTFLCNTELNEAFNETINTIYTLCGEGSAENSPGGQDYEIPFEVFQTKGVKSFSEYIYKNKHNQNARVNIPVRLDNTLMNARTEFTGAIILDSAGGAAEETALISGTIKPFKGKVTVTDIPASVPASGVAKKQ